MHHVRADCAAIINDGKVADYDGIPGPITFDEVGDPTEATIGIYQYGGRQPLHSIRGLTADTRQGPGTSVPGPCCFCRMWQVAGNDLTCVTGLQHARIVRSFTHEYPALTGLARPRRARPFLNTFDCKEQHERIREGQRPTLAVLRAVPGTIAVVGTSAVVLAGCAAPSDGGGDGGPAEDLTLKIGTALPVTGNLAFLGPPEIAGTEYAASDVNAAAAGVTVELIQGDSGDTDNKAYETEIPRLLGEDVSAIIGAASSGTSLQFIDQVVGAGVIQFSPANTSAAFTDYDDQGLYFRTAPSDVLQGEVLGNLIAEDGNETLGMIVLNDSSTAPAWPSSPRRPSRPPAAPSWPRPPTTRVTPASTRRSARFLLLRPTPSP